MSEAPRGQLVNDGVISRRRGDAKEAAFAPEARRKEKLQPLRVAGMLALAHQCEALIASRVIANRTELAGVLGFTKARVTQLLDLTLLALDISGGDSRRGGRAGAGRSDRARLARSRSRRDVGHPAGALVTGGAQR